MPPGAGGPRDPVARALGAVEGGGVGAPGAGSGEDRPADRGAAALLGPVRGGPDHRGHDGPARPAAAGRSGRGAGRAGARDDGLPAEPDPAVLPGAPRRQPDPRPPRSRSASWAPTRTATAGCAASSASAVRGAGWRPASAWPGTRSSANARASTTTPTSTPRHAAGSPADAFVRLVRRAADALDKTLQRTGHRGERGQVVLHHDVDPDGTLGPGQLHLGDVVPDTVARFLGCDAEVRVAAWQAGQLLGINPTERTVPAGSVASSNGATRAASTRSATAAAGCTSTTSSTGPTAASPSPSNLLCLCTLHHRELHEGLFTHRRRPRGRPAAVPRRPRETDRATRTRLARAPPPRRALALHPALRRTPRHRFLHLELVKRGPAEAHPRDSASVTVTYVPSSYDQR